ncbi:MAG: efflux RND transporter permease subunit [Pseudomonadota bacterium]
MASPKRMRDDLLDRGIDRVYLYGARPEEVWVELDPRDLLKLDLKLADVATTIRQTSQDLPSGELSGGEQQVRSLGLLRRAEELKEVEVKALPDGRKILLGDVAKVSEAFKEDTQQGIRGSDPAIELEILRSPVTDALTTASTVDEYLEEIRATLPAQLEIEAYDVRAKSIRERIQLLVTNGLGGLLLVLGVLFLFLNARVAFWVAVGIPASLMATVAIMWASGQTINMISMFGMIMAIGIVVDDAIVVGEHAEQRFRDGLSPVEAAIAGAKRMAAPVSSSTLTTICAFMPLFLISGIMGQIIAAIPFVVVAVLIASLIECFFVLPGHLSHALAPRPGLFQRSSLLRAIGDKAVRFQARFDKRFVRFRETGFRTFAQRAIAGRYVTAAIAIGAFVVSVGAVLGGKVGYQFFPSPEPDRIYANIKMMPGTARADTRATLAKVDAALFRGLETLADDPDDVVVLTMGKIGGPVGSTPFTSVSSTDTLGGIAVELVSSDRRDVLAREVITAWRQAVGDIAGLESLTFAGARAGPPGGDVDVRLSGGEPKVLKAASLRVQELLKRYPAVSDIDDNLPYSKPEKIIKLNDRGRAMGFTTEDVARQVRNAIDGAIAKRFPRDDEEVWVRVQFAREDVNVNLLDRLYLRSPSGAEVPLKAVVDTRDDLGFSRIRREGGRREVAVSGELDLRQSSTGEITRSLEKDGLLDIAAEYGLDYRFAGRAEEQRDTNSDMLLGTTLGLTCIYIVLAWVFSSYTRPLVVMSVIPIGFVGAVIGHAVWGVDLTILSIFAILGLSGIVINDSIVLVTTIDERLKSEQVIDALVNGSCDRLRAVFLTSATTIGGLTPLLFEKSLQAQFLIPMALTLVFGLATATFIVLLLVPALIMIQHDLGTFFRNLFAANAEQPSEA